MNDESVLKKSKTDYAAETAQLFVDFSGNNRNTWGLQAIQDREFRLGKQWSDEDAKTLEDRQQAALVINRIHPAVELAKAMLTAKRPTFRVTAMEDSDNKTAHAMNGFIQYIWNISSGDRQMNKCIDDFYVTGLGALLCYIDPFADGGRGEVKFRAIDPLQLYIDPNSQDPFCSDASDIIISRVYTKGQMERIYPKYKSAINTANGNPYSEIPGGSVGSDNLIVFAGAETSANHDGDYVRGYERYTKVWVDLTRVFEKWSKQEFNLTEEQLTQYLEKDVWVLNGSIVKEEVIAQQMAQNLIAQYEQQMQQYEQALSQAEQDPVFAQQLIDQGIEPPQQPNIQQTKMSAIVEAGNVSMVKVPMQRIYMGVVAGDKFLYGRLLSCEEYPIITLMNMHTGSPYPLSDVRMIKDLQKYVNKIKSLIVAHASTSTNVKVMVPRGTDTEALKQQWAQPGAIIEIDFAEGAPIPVMPLPMPNELYQNEIVAKSDIDHQLGLYDTMMGNSSNAPDTYRGIMMMDEFGQRRIRVKQAVVEDALQMLGKLLISFIQEFYVAEKQIRILQPNNSMTEFAVNKRLYDNYGETVGTLNDVSVGKYDVLVVSGSTLPSNRFAQLEFYRDMYRDQIIDRVEVLKKTDVFDIEGVLQRIDTIEQLQAALEQSQEEIKQLKGDMQTRDRELFHTKLNAAVNQEAFKAKEQTLEQKKANELYTARLGDTLKNAGNAAATEVKNIRMEERDRMRNKPTKSKA